MSNIDKQALNQEKIEWLNKLADMEYCKSNPGHWLMSLKDTNMLAKLALRSVALLDELEAAEKRIAELEAREVKLPELKMLRDYLAEVTHREREDILVGVRLEFFRVLKEAGVKVAAAGKGE
ncbi:hypothetical protein [Enterobacter kobei]|uniref:hypothetical protein n=1 Tax=Enterobacter kobei TaxID=208224 RepID=UPI0039C94B43